jgi:F0F1-type ATP synthase membrane subunit b/b'
MDEMPELPTRVAKGSAMKSRLAKISVTAAALVWPTWASAGEGEPVEGSWFALIFYTLNFLLFLWIAGRYGWPRISQFFRNRSHTIREIRTRADKALQEAQELAHRAAQELERLEADKHELMSELEEQTAYIIVQIKNAASEAVNRIRRDTELTKIALRDGAQRRLRQTMAEAAGRIARAIISRNLQPADQARLLRGFVDRIGEEARP